MEQTREFHRKNIAIFFLVNRIPEDLRKNPKNQQAPVTGSFLCTVHTAPRDTGVYPVRYNILNEVSQNGKYQPWQKVFLTGGNKNLIKEATVLKYTGDLYTIHFYNGGSINVRESGICPSGEKAEPAILNHKR